MKALVIVAHGSRRNASNDEVRELSRKVSEVLGNDYSIVNTGFLELAEPLIPDSIEQCIVKGATHVEVLPYFLSAGRHVTEDVPSEVAKAQAKFPDVEIVIKPYIGGLPEIVTLIAKSLS